MAKSLPFELTKNEELIDEFPRSGVPYIFIGLLTLLVSGFFFVAFFQLYGAGESWVAAWFGIKPETGAEIAGIFGFLSALSLVFGLIAAYIYSLNRMFLTNEHIVRIKQYGLVATDKKVISHLNIEDIKARQNLVGRIFGYGLLTMSTEGQNATYEINFIKQPFDYVRIATDVRDDYQQSVIDSGAKAIPLVEKR
jgi:uncharacterized membrane protein YdbT with pleckstrin-like domain